MGTFDTTLDHQIHDVEGAVKTVRRNNKITDEQLAEQAARREEQRIAYGRQHGWDHHWDREHPDYDPNCACGYETTVPETSRKNAAAAAVAETIDDISDDSRVQANRRRQKNMDRKMAQPMTENQERFIRSLISQISDPHLISEAESFLAQEERPSKQKASKWIERLKEVADNDDSKPKRTNRYAGDCSRCGRNVEAETGELYSLSGQWRVRHFPECPPAPAESPQTAEDHPGTAELGPDSLDLRELPSGRYAVPDGDTRLKVKVDNLHLDKARNPKWDGYIFVSDGAEYGSRTRYGMQRPGSEYQGKIQDQLRAILADPLAAMVAYGKLTGSCGRCGRLLENEESIALGIGPVCRRQFS